MFIDKLEDNEVDDLMNSIISANGYNPEKFSTISIFDHKTDMLYMVATCRELKIEFEIAANDFLCRSIDEDSTALNNLYSIESKTLRRHLKQKFGNEYVLELENFVENLKQEILKD